MIRGFDGMACYAHPARTRLCWLRGAGPDVAHASVVLAWKPQPKELTARCAVYHCSTLSNRVEPSVLTDATMAQQHRPSDKMPTNTMPIIPARI